MQVKVVTGKIQTQEAQIIVVSLFEGTKDLEGAISAVDKALNKQIQALIDLGDFKGKRNEIAVIYPQSLIPAKRVIIAGLGKAEKFTLDIIRQVSGTVAKKARALGATQIHTVVHGAEIEGITPEAAAQAVTEGSIMGLYRFRELKTKMNDTSPDIEALVLVNPEAKRQTLLESGAKAGQIIAESTSLARDLVNRPSNIATPYHLAEQAEKIAAETKLEIQIIEEEELEEMSMHTFLSVSHGGGEPPCLIVMEHNMGRKDLPTIALVGKGITFDTGGISLKPSTKMELMKGDMGGAAAVIGAMRAIVLLDLPLHVVGIVPATENMPDAHATKPGDVVFSRKGLTIEIINTDAEGRLILADGLSYAGEFEPDAVFDIATLTGGRVVALGAQAAAVMGDKTLTDRLQTAGENAHERVWPLPLFEEYGEQLKSLVADVKNIGGREASSITAGFFLSKFAPEDTPWVHIDIAGLDQISAARPYMPKGATGFGVRLLVETLRHWKDI